MDIEENLAFERTLLSKERTMLAYFRTALTAFLFGIALMNLFHTKSSYTFGTIFILLGIVFAIIGLFYITKKKKEYKIL